MLASYPPFFLEWCSTQVSCQYNLRINFSLVSHGLVQKQDSHSTNYKTTKTRHHVKDALRSFTGSSHTIIVSGASRGQRGTRGHTAGWHYILNHVVRSYHHIHRIWCFYHKTHNYFTYQLYYYFGQTFWKKRLSISYNTWFVFYFSLTSLFVCKHCHQYIYINQHAFQRSVNAHGPLVECAMLRGLYCALHMFASSTEASI